MRLSTEGVMPTPEATDDGLPLDVDLRGKTEEQKIELMAQRRANFLGRLVKAGEISPEYLRDPETQAFLDQFAMVPQSGRDSLMHWLIGDDHGGLHHLRTVHALGLGDRMVASDSEVPDQQYILEDGQYRVLHVGLRKKPGETITKPRGSTMYPDEWSTQDVLCSVQEAMKSESPVEGKVPRSLNHYGWFKGILVKAITRQFDGIRYIRTGFTQYTDNWSKEENHGQQ